MKLILNIIFNVVLFFILRYIVILILFLVFGIGADKPSESCLFLVPLLTLIIQGGGIVTFFKVKSNMDCKDCIVSFLIVIVLSIIDFLSLLP